MNKILYSFSLNTNTNSIEQYLLCTNETNNIEQDWWRMNDIYNTWMGVNNIYSKQMRTNDIYSMLMRAKRLQYAHFQDFIRNNQEMTEN
jgi:hypothetical protein